MEQLERLFLEVLRAAIRGDRVHWQGVVEQETMQKLLGLARQHHVWGMTADAVYGCPDAQLLEPEQRADIRRELLTITTAHAVKMARFAKLYGKMEAEGFRVLIMKGLACRSLYPNPALRPSSDEDLLVPADQFAQAAKWLRKQGMQQTDPNASEDAFELGFVGNGLSLELHCTRCS